MCEEETTALIYCNLVSQQFVGDISVRCMRTFVSLSTTCPHKFQNIYYVHVDRRRFKEIGIEFLTNEGLHIPFEDSTLFRWVRTFLWSGKKMGRETLRTGEKILPISRYASRLMTRVLVTSCLNTSLNPPKFV